MGEGKKKTSLLVRLLVFLTVLAIAIVTPIVTLYICFYDNKAKSIDPDPDFNAERMFKDKAVFALDEVEDKESLVFNVGEDDMNQLMLKANDGIHQAFPQLKKFFMGLNVETGDEEYVFIANAKIANFFKTRVKLYTTLTTEEIDGEESLVFTIKEIRLGRVKVKKTNSVVKKVVNDEFVSKMFQSTSLSFIADVEANDRIYYPKSHIATDLNIFDSESADSFYSTVVKEFYHQGLFSVDANKEGFKGVIDLKPVHTNTHYVEPLYENEANWNDLKAKVKTVLEHSDLTDDEGIDLYKFLIVGYDRLEEEKKEFISNLSLESIGIDDPETYEPLVLKYDGLAHPGHIVKPEKEIYDLVDNEVDTTLLGVPFDPIDPTYHGHTFATISEKDLSATLAASDSIGTPFLFSHKARDGKYTVCTFAIDNMYANIYNNSLKLTIGLSINGYETYICIGGSFTTSNMYTVNFKIDEINYGENPSTDEFKSEIYRLIHDALKDDKVVNMDEETKIMSFSIEECLKDPGQKESVEAYGVTHEITGTQRSDEGKIIYKLA